MPFLFQAVTRKQGNITPVEQIPPMPAGEKETFIYYSTPRKGVEAMHGENPMLMPEQEKLISKLFFSRDEMPKLQAMLSGGLSQYFKTYNLPEEKPRHLGIVYPEIAFDELILSERPFIDRAYAPGSARYDPSLLWAAQIVAAKVEAYVGTYQDTGQDVIVALRVPVESPATIAREENRRIRQALGRCVADMLSSKGISAKVMVSEVNMTFGHLSDQILIDGGSKKGNWADVKKALLYDATGSDGMRLFSLGGSPAIPANDERYDALALISEANGAQALIEAMKLLGKEKVFFPNHRSFPALKECYNSLRYAGISLNFGISIEPDSGLLFMRMPGKLTPQELSDVAQKFEKQGLIAAYLDENGNRKEIQLQLMRYDTKGPIAGDPGNPFYKTDDYLMVFTDEKARPLDVYSLLLGRGYAFDLITRDSEGSMRTAYKAVDLGAPEREVAKRLPVPIKKRERKRKPIVLKKEDLPQKLQDMGFDKPVKAFLAYDGSYQIKKEYSPSLVAEFEDQTFLKMLAACGFDVKPFDLTNYGSPDPYKKTGEPTNYMHYLTGFPGRVKNWADGKTPMPNEIKQGLAIVVGDFAGTDGTPEINGLFRPLGRDRASTLGWYQKAWEALDEKGIPFKFQFIMVSPDTYRANNTVFNISVRNEQNFDDLVEIISPDKKVDMIKTDWGYEATGVRGKVIWVKNKVGTPECKDFIQKSIIDAFNSNPNQASGEEAKN